MKTYYFDTTEKAYIATQSGERVKTGDLLVIRPERVVGVAHTWPFAVSLLSGKLRPIDRVTTEVPGIGAAVIVAARALSRRLAFDRPAIDPPLNTSVYQDGRLYDLVQVDQKESKKPKTGGGAW